MDDSESWGICFLSASLWFLDLVVVPTVFLQVTWPKIGILLVCSTVYRNNTDSCDEETVCPNPGKIAVSAALSEEKMSCKEAAANRRVTLHTSAIFGLIIRINRSLFTIWNLSLFTVNRCGTHTQLHTRGLCKWTCEVSFLTPQWCLCKYTHTQAFLSVCQCVTDPLWVWMSILRGLDKGSLCCSWAQLTLKGGIDTGTAPSGCSSRTCIHGWKCWQVQSSKGLKVHIKDTESNGICSVVSLEIVTKMSGSLLK